MVIPPIIGNVYKPYWPSPTIWNNGSWSTRPKLAHMGGSLNLGDTCFWLVVLSHHLKNMRHSNWIISPCFPKKHAVSGLKCWKKFGETCRKLSSSLGSFHQHVQVPEMDVLMHLSNTNSKAYLREYTTPYKAAFWKKAPFKLGTTKSYGSCFWGPGNLRVKIQLDVACFIPKCGWKITKTKSRMPAASPPWNYITPSVKKNWKSMWLEEIRWIRLPFWGRKRPNF